MVLLTFNNKYVIQSQVTVTTTSTVFVDDSEASQTFTLNNPKTVLVIYQENNNHLEPPNFIAWEGKKSAINIDGMDFAKSYDTNYGDRDATRNCTFWIGSFSAGTHTIKGRFATNGTDPARIDNRILLIYIFNGDEYQYIDNGANTVNSNSATFVDDTFASVTFTPSGNCKAIYLYNCSNITGTEDWAGKKNAISINGFDYSQAEKSPVDVNKPDSIFTCYGNALTPVSTTVKGRFATNRPGYTVSIDSRQLGVLLLDNSTALDVVVSDSQISTTSNILVNDTEALISRDLSETRELLTIAMGTKRNGTSSNPRGEAYGISVDTIDKQISRASPFSSNFSNSAATCWAETALTGTHTVQGRLSNNYPGDTATIDSRRIIAIWFSQICPIDQKYSGDSIYLKATPIQGVAPYTIEFRRSNTQSMANAIDNTNVDTDTYLIPGGIGGRLNGESNPVTGVSERIRIIRRYTIDINDINDATSKSPGEGPSLIFGSKMIDSCSPQQICVGYCKIFVICPVPSCDFTVT